MRGGGNGLLILAALGGGAYWAYRAGYLPQLAPVVEGVTDWVRPPASFLPETEWARGAEQKAAWSAAVKEASGGKVLPILGPGEVVALNEYEAMLRRYPAELSAWARQNIAWAAAIAMTENARRIPTLSGDNGTSHGVFQVKVATAETCYRAGYTRHQPTRENLLTFEGCIYFGTAEMERLSKINPDLDWVIQAYNGGAGFQKMDEKYQRDRAAYLNRVKRNFVRLYSNGKGADV